MSPQLNNWIYGYFPHSWLQHLRGGGYRPIVFLNHGLWVGFFLLIAVLAAIGVARDGTRMQRGMALLGAVWIFLVLSISHNLGAFLVALLTAPAALLFPVRGQIRIAVLVGLIFLSYPMIKQVTLGPVEQFRQAVAAVAPDRAASLGVRLSNEEQLLNRANLKPAFGWGGWGRQMIYNDYGRRLSVVDGLWIIQFGKTGWLGYLSYFGLLVVPLLFLRRAARRKEIPIATGTLAMIAAANFIYMIPNATLTPVSMLIFGALAGMAQFDTADKGTPAASAATEQRSREVRYTRFGADRSPQYRRS
ncbi:MAG: hypothetical protein EX266_17695 [Rhodobacteraceae bacterium]|nr:MAG: hypothetical protein EX266_17695 [Paracoccaceae bacterium]